MYCPTCRQERLGGFAACVVCGTVLNRRSREEVEQELAHVQFLLNDIAKWSDGEVSVSGRKYVRNRYQQMQRVLQTVLQTPEGETAEVKSWQTPVEAPATTPLADVVSPRPNEVVPPAAATHADVPLAAATQEAVPPSAAMNEVASPIPANVVVPDGAPAPHREAVVSAARGSPPVAPLFPAFEVPHTPTPEEQVVEEASKWNEIWKPFLSERIGWFIGAFLILAGSFFFVAVSWSGMSELMQTLVVFGLTAVYSAAFSIGGVVLGKKPNFDSAGKVLMLIGSAVAPLANLAFLTAQGVERVVGAPVSFAWAAACAVLFGLVAKQVDEKTQRPMQALMFASALSMALSPLVVRFGTPMLWLNAIPLLLVQRIFRHDDQRSSEATWFAVCAPLYLTALFSIRLHIALRLGEALPPVATYAPFVALLLASVLRLRKLDSSRASDALSVAVVASQIALVFASAFGEAPALFATCAVLGVTTWQLARGENVRRAGWFYGTYVAAQLAYKTCGQLVPGIVQGLIVQVKQTLGHAASAPFPFNFDAVFALPFVLVGAGLAVRIFRKAEATNNARDLAVAEVLLRSTAGAAVFYAAVSFAGSDYRASLWSIPVYALLCLVLGQWLQRAYLVLTGSFLLLAVPVFSFLIYGAPASALATGVVALLLAAFSVVQTKPTRIGVSWAAGLLAASAVGLAWLGAPPQLAGVIGVVFGGAAALLVARNLDNRTLLSGATAILVSAVPLFFLFFHPEAAPFSAAVAGLALAFLSARDPRTHALTPVVTSAALIAPLWSWSIQQSAQAPMTLLGPTLVVAGLSLLEVGRRDASVRPFGAVLLVLALFPSTTLFEAFAFNTPFVSAAALAGVSLLASVLAAYRKKDAATAVTLVCMALIGSAVAAGLAAVAGEGYIPTVGLAALGALLTSRALHPSFSVPYATLLGLGCAAIDGHTDAMLAQAVFLSLLALIPLSPAIHQLLLGKKSIATAASLSAALVLFICGAKIVPHPTLLTLSVYAVLPLVWVRASRRAWFAFLLAPLMSVFLGAWSGFKELMFLVPVVVAVATRLIGQVPVMRGLVTEGDEKRTERTQGFALAGLGVVALSLLAYALSRQVPATDASMLLWFAAGFVAAAGGPLWLRMLAATVLAAPVPEVRPYLMPALMATGFLAHHLPKYTHAVLGAPQDKRSPAFLALIAIAVTFVPGLTHWANNGDVLLFAAALFTGAFLLRQSWILPVAMLVAASTSLGFAPLDQSWLIRGVEFDGFAVMALVGAFAAALLSHDGRNQKLQAFSRRIAPGFQGDLHVPMWFAGLLPAAAAVLLCMSDVGSETMPIGVACCVGLSALLLLVTKDRVQTVMATVLGGALLVVAISFAWVPVGLATFGLLLALAGAYFEGELENADALHHAGWVTAAASALFCRSLHHVATPLCFAIICATGWAMVWRRREREAIGWSGSLLFGHVLLFHLGVVLSTGKPPTYIFPYISALSAIMAAVVASFATEKLRRTLLTVFASIALMEIVSGILLLPLSSGETAMREALIAAVGMGVLVVALVRFSLKHSDATFAYLAQVAMLLGYVALRVHGAGPGTLGTQDAVTSLIAGALCSGLYVWARRQDEGHVFVKPAWLGAIGLPLLGLFAVPWNSPLVAACLLMGHAAHFAVTSKLTERSFASILATCAFNAALIFVWLGTGFGGPQYYIIPAALSALVLVRVFKDDFTAATEARLRATAVTAIYLAAAWPILFDSTWQMLLCALICVLGVGVGVAMRIRSYVYLGTGFLVSTIISNLVVFGVRDSRVGALFLLVLGMLVVGFMIYLTAQRAQVLARYERVRNMLATWEA